MWSRQARAELPRLVAGQASALSSKVSLLMVKYDLEHSGSGPGGMSVAEAIE